ncbi:hypothetical protein ABKN59_003561 [Abortiporus biennis]
MDCFQLSCLTRSFSLHSKRHSPIRIMNAMNDQSTYLYQTRSSIQETYTVYLHIGITESQQSAFQKISSNKEHLAMRHMHNTTTATEGYVLVAEIVRCWYGQSSFYTRILVNAKTSPLSDSKRPCRLLSMLIRR